MIQKQIKVGHLHLTMSDIIGIKLGLSLALTAAFFIPAPWHIPVGIGANLVWIWRL